MCGEHSVVPLALESSAGSSPHVRGAHLLDDARKKLAGIIPACAGSTNWTRLETSLTRDHPRMCGEHNAIAANSLNQSGSSPHVRGALRRQMANGREWGIIPACAGSTAAAAVRVVVGWDHPRMCGEHNVSFGITNFPQGSSPHVRGALVAKATEGVGYGIIPACAGSTISIRSRNGSRRDHPRMCGEHEVDLFEALCHQGSSPHVRGAQVRVLGDYLRRGIIPACAGSTPATSLFP